jgi:hypothetical protein
LAIRHLLQIKKLANSDIAEPALSAASLPVPIFLLDRLLLSESMAVCFIRGGNEQFDYIVGNPVWLSYSYFADPKYQLAAQPQLAKIGEC